MAGKQGIKAVVVPGEVAAVGLPAPLLVVVVAAAVARAGDLLREEAAVGLLVHRRAGLVVHPAALVQVAGPGGLLLRGAVAVASASSLHHLLDQRRVLQGAPGRRSRLRCDLLLPLVRGWVGPIRAVNRRRLRCPRRRRERLYGRRRRLLLYEETETTAVLAYRQQLTNRASERIAGTGAVGADPRDAGDGGGAVVGGRELGVRRRAAAVPPQRGGDVGAVVEHGDPEQRGEREYRGHLHPPAGHPNSERAGPALPPRDPHRRGTGRN